MAGGRAWQGIMHSRGHACQGAYMVGRGGACVAEGGMHDKGHVSQEIWPLQQTVRIPLECILVIIESSVTDLGCCFIFL